MRVCFKAFTLSLLIHLGLLALLIGLPSSLFKKPKPSPKIVELSYEPTRTNILHQSLKRASGTRQHLTQKLALNNESKIRKKIDIFSLKPQISTGDLSAGAKPQDGSTDPFVDNYLDSPRVDNVNAAWGSGAGTFERAKDYLLMKKIYEHIDNVLIFPSFFHRNKIEGAINVRLVIDFDGKCDWRQIKFYGEKPFMQLYVLSVLRSACKQNFKPFLKQRILTNVDLSFQFELSEPINSKVIEENKFIVGNTLMFYRNSYKSIMEWEFGPFQGIFPVPAIYLNIPWIQENWDKIMYSKDPILEFKKEFGS